ncbi:VapC toxin family PIN domain ribonuclease [Candidatus Woesearchaeota archaeon]|nr:MAG: VapC toxin family PIN domain ribonuclease [Candidatus Woesearchaeota archaeon]
MPKRVVADANVLVKWFVPEEYSDSAELLMNDHLHGIVTVTAPLYALLEFTNTLRKYVIRGLLSKDMVIRALKLLEEVDIEYVSMTFDTLREAFSYALEKGVTVYDACYILLARNYGVNMYTADEKLLGKLANEEENVKHIKEYHTHDFH